MFLVHGPKKSTFRNVLNRGMFPCSRDAIVNDIMGMASQMQIDLHSFGCLCLSSMHGLHGRTPDLHAEMSIEANANTDAFFHI